MHLLPELPAPNAALPDPTHLLDDEQNAILGWELAVIARNRQDVEAECASLRLS